MPDSIRAPAIIADVGKAGLPCETAAPTSVNAKSDATASAGRAPRRIRRPAIIEIAKESSTAGGSATFHNAIPMARTAKLVTEVRQPRASSAIIHSAGASDKD